MRRLLLSLAAAGITLVTQAFPAASTVERSQVPERYTWDLTDLYPDEAAWAAARDAAIGRIPGVDRFRGRLGESAAVLLEALDTVMGLDRDLGRVRFYAERLYDQDTRVGHSLEMFQSAEQAQVRFRAAASFLHPEILALDAQRVRGFVRSEPKLKDYAVFLEDILRRKPHTLGADEERVAAQAGNLTRSGESVYSVLTNADFPRPEVTLSTGETVRLDSPAYSRYRASGNRSDRDLVFKAFFGTYAGFERTLGAALYAQVKAHLFYRDVHRFGSSLEAVLFEYDIPVEVYHRLIADVRANLPTLHRYLALRKRMLGVDRLRYEDLYAPVVSGIAKTYTPDEAVNLVVDATAPLGKEYQEEVRRAFSDRWVDFLPSTGKRSGAYSEGAFGVHPYQLQNFVGKYDDVSTLAHEFGHSMHSLLSDRAQPYATHDYSTFVAEVASTFNENLLFRRMLDRAQDDATRLSLLGSRLETLRSTLFRQTMFAEFELAIHEKAERGEPLTGEALSRLYLGLVREYYGHDRAVCEVGDLYGVEWAYVPHFYWNFYVYQYATSLTASITLADAVLAEAARPGGGTARRDAYLALLRAGSSKYPVDLLRDAGVDMTTSAPFAAAMREMNEVIDRMEEILARAR